VLKHPLFHPGLPKELLPKSEVGHVAKLASSLQAPQPRFQSWAPPSHERYGNVFHLGMPKKCLNLKVLPFLKMDSKKLGFWWKRKTFVLRKNEPYISKMSTVHPRRGIPRLFPIEKGRSASVLEVLTVVDPSPCRRKTRKDSFRPTRPDPYL